MAVAYLTRKVRFSAAHRYYRPEWSEEENRRVFAGCANPHGHGHNYLLEVTVRGDVDATTGFGVDLARLDDLLATEVVARFDHQHLNHAIPEFREGNRVPTTENILLYLWPRLAVGLGDDVALVRLRLHEDETLFTDYYGDTEPYQ